MIIRKINRRVLIIGLVIAITVISSAPSHRGALAGTHGAGGGGTTGGLLLVDGTDPLYLVNGTSGVCLVAGGC